MESPLFGQMQANLLYMASSTCLRALTCLVLLAVPCVPGAHELAGVLRIGMNRRQHIFTETM